MKNIKKILNYLATKWLRNLIIGLYSLIDVFAGVDEAAEAAEVDGFTSLLIGLFFGSAAATPAIVEIYVNIADDIAIWK